jgi:glyoxylase-like metal-dependent hydrolase (beta-lactamase superfamily II)
MRTCCRARPGGIAGAVVALALALALALAPAAAGAAPQQPAVKVEVVPIHANLFMLAGAGQNIALQTGADGTVLVGAGAAGAAAAVLDAIRAITDQPIRYIIDTSADPAAIGGSGALAQAGRSINWTGPAPRGPPGAGFGATILAPNSVLLRVSGASGQGAALPMADWPSQAFDSPRKYIYFNHEAIEVYRQTARDDTDSIVFFRASDVIAAGDVIDADRFPRIDVDNGGGIQGEIDALNHILALSDRSIPFVYEPGGTYIIPSHGRLYQQADVVQYRDMVVEIRDIIQSMISRHRTLAQIEAASPCLAYEREYGRQSGDWTTNDFVQAIYESLTHKTRRATRN